MNIMLPPKELPPREPGRPWLASILIGLFVLLVVAALIAHVLEGSNVLQAFLEHAARPRVVKANIVEQYTRFRREDAEAGSVMTGFEFASSNDRSPASQYCYFTPDKTGSGVNLHLPLGRKVPGEDAVFFPIAQNPAELVGLSADVAAKLARERCHFDEWE